MVNNTKAYKIAKLAIIFATIFVAMMIDRVIGIVFTLGLALELSTAAVVLLVTFSFCFVENDWFTALIAWLFFGLASFIKEFIPGFGSAVSLFPIYYRPLITILPRIACGAIAFGSYRLMLLATAKVTNARKRQIISMVVAIFLGNVANTALFLTTLNVFRLLTGEAYKSIVSTLNFIWATNIIPEYLISMIIAPFVVLGVRRGLKLGFDGNNWKRARDEK